MKNLVNRDLDEFLFEKESIPKTKKAKEEKFKTVMHEFGKGKLKPFHSNKPLKSKKQKGSKKELAQAQAIAFSEADLSVKK